MPRNTASPIELKNQSPSPARSCPIRTISNRRDRDSGRISALSDQVESPDRKENASKQKARSRSAIDSKNLERDAGGKTLHTFPHPAREPVPEDSVAQLD